MRKNVDVKNIALDFLAINFAWFVYYLFRVRSGIVASSLEPDLWMPMFLVWVYWLLVFSFFGLYKPWHAASRTDEVTTLIKAISAGCIVLFFIIFIDDASLNTQSNERMLIFAYWGIMVATTGTGRILYRTVRRRLLVAGVGLRNALIVGWNAKARDLLDRVLLHPALGYHVVGFVKLDKRKTGTEYKGMRLLGSTEDIPSLIDRYSVRDILIALESSDHDKLLDVISHCNSHDVSLKILPDMYDIISGQARTNQIYGFPLIEIMPEIMQPWEQSMKRLTDVVVSLIVLALTSPLWIVIAAAIKIDTPGPVVYSQERVGKDGKVFKMYKFRSMRADAEKDSGPVWAPQHDSRVTKVGRFLRNTRLDEIPQFVNVLDGDMSLVGPRPERPFFVDKLSKEIPLYHRRLKVRPGITGWAQIKQGYDRSIEDVKSKVRYDLFYIENMSFRMDLKILLFTLYIMLMGKGH
ncbi:MAG TPA: undecaprenyl-phosphate glucose phosphotransferase [Bacteroidota bacterium]|nr:undecaprenyl-phosphate glucose phosphotransferase [Bacteroidota bacterium]